MSTQSRPKTKPGQQRSPWPLVFILSGVLLLVVVAALGLRSGSNGVPALEVSQIQATPTARVEGLKINFGDMPVNTSEAILNIRVTNTGDGVLRFTDAPYVEIADGC